MYVPLVSREAVNTAELDRRALLGICQAAGIDEIGVFVFTLQPGEEDDATVFSRMFAPAFGVPEDPATGAAMPFQFLDLFFPSSAESPESG